MQRKVGILMGGISSEREVSISTGSAVIKACEQLDYHVLVLQFEKNYKKFKSQMQDCDIIFNALHGGIGERLQSLQQLRELPRPSRVDLSQKTVLSEVLWSVGSQL